MSKSRASLNLSVQIQWGKCCSFNSAFSLHRGTHLDPQENLSKPLQPWVIWEYFMCKSSHLQLIRGLNFISHSVRTGYKILYSRIRFKLWRWYKLHSLQMEIWPLVFQKACTNHNFERLKVWLPFPGLPCKLWRHCCCSKFTKFQKGFLTTDANVFSFIFLHSEPIYSTGSCPNTKNKSNKSNKVIILISNAINNICLITQIIRKWKYDLVIP